MKNKIRAILLAALLSCTAYSAAVEASASPITVFHFLDSTYKDTVWGVPYQIQSNCVGFFPVCKPVMTTIGILTFMHVWNEFPFTRVLIVREELKTFPLGLTFFTSQYTTNYTLLLAALTLSTLPLLVLYLFCYKNIMKGMMAGAVKG